MGVVLFILVAVYLLYLAIKGKGKIYSLERIYEDKVKLHVKQVRILLFIDAAMLLGVSALELLGIFEDMVWLRFVLGAVIIAPLIAIPALTYKHTDPEKRFQPVPSRYSDEARNKEKANPGHDGDEEQRAAKTPAKPRTESGVDDGSAENRFTILTPRTLSKSIDKRD